MDFYDQKYFLTKLGKFVIKSLNEDNLSSLLKEIIEKKKDWSKDQWIEMISFGLQLNVNHEINLILWDQHPQSRQMIKEILWYNDLIKKLNESSIECQIYFLLGRYAFHLDRKDICKEPYSYYAETFYHGRKELIDIKKDILNTYFIDFVGFTEDLIIIILKYEF
jgi:hypothetical protein